jgi:hypothetical protein
MDNIDRNRVIELYRSGMSMKEIRNIFGCDYYRIQSIVKNIPEFKNLKSRRRKDIPFDKVIELYNEGKSELYISKTFNTDRGTIRRMLVKNNVVIRNGSQANIIRFQNSTIEERKKVTQKANEAMKNMPDSFHVESSKKQAITKQKTQSKMGIFEDIIFNEFRKRKYKPVLQKAFDVYNIDIAVGNIAVEIHVNSSNPHTYSFYRKRVEYLTNRNWNVIYVKITQGGLNRISIDNVCRIIDFLRTNPSLIGKYWMVRGTGEVTTIGKFDFDKKAFVFTPIDSFDIVRVYP